MESKGKRGQVECCTRCQEIVAGFGIDRGKPVFAEKDVAKPWTTAAYVEECTFEGLMTAVEDISSGAVLASSFPDNIFGCGSHYPGIRWDVVRNDRDGCVLHLVPDYSKRMKIGPWSVDR